VVPTMTAVAVVVVTAGAGGRWKDSADGDLGECIREYRVLDTCAEKEGVKICDGVKGTHLTWVCFWWWCAGEEQDTAMRQAGI